MKSIKIELANEAYEIKIGRNSFHGIKHLLNKNKVTGPVVFVSDTNVMDYQGKAIRSFARNIKNGAYYITVPAGESSKSVKMFQEVTQKIADLTAKNKPVLAAFGGGVVGDLAGFVAATYRRGVCLIQIPTSLLAQVDSSIGGKVGVDLLQAKNLVGAFKQPLGVYIDTGFLKTLPKRHLKNGLGEVVKYALLSEGSLFELLEDRIEDVMSLKQDVVEKVVYQCAVIKSKIVEMDEFDVKDIRIILNLGHTMGHALETACGYSNKYNHGEAVALGMLIAGEISLRLGKLKMKDLIKMRSLIKKVGLPLSIKKVDTAKIMNAYLHDKKFVKGINKFVLPRRIGAVEIVENVPVKIIKQAVRRYVA